MAEKFSLSSASDYFKTKYGPASFNTYDSKTVVLSQLSKQYDLNGDSFEEVVPLSQGAGVGSSDGTILPRASVWKSDTADFTPARVYARAKIDRQAIYAAKNEGAFVDSLKEVVKRAVNGWSRNIERQLFTELGSVDDRGSGVLGVIDSVVAAAPVYTCVITAATWKEANWEEGDVVNVETGNTDLFEVTTVTPSTRTVVLTRVTGSQIPVATDEVHMQYSEDNDIVGIKGVVDAVAGTLYGIPVARRWQSYRYNAASAPLTVDMLNDVMLELDRLSGDSANLIVVSHLQWARFASQLEDQKRYTIVSPQNEALKGKVGFKALAYDGPTGSAAIVTSRFCETDRAYCLNTMEMKLKHMQGFGWFEDDGTVFLREADSDGYEARFGGYLNLYVNPVKQAVIYGLDT